MDSRSSFNALLPEQFGKYSLLGHLATGGMAEVWLARQLGIQGFEKIVVIKRARPELTDAETTQLFLDEARLVATLEHPNIAQVYEIGAVNGSYFFVMEYVDGADLRRLIEAAIAKRHPITLADALYIITHVCTALHYAHEKHDLEGRPLRLIHRDVSPSNVLVSHDGAIKVCDFGIAKAKNRKTEDTQSGVLKGKFSYMSPEQCSSKPIDRRSDVFSIGILLYELSTLTKLFRGTSDFALLQQIVEKPIPPPSLRVPTYPRELEKIVMKALAKSPDDRYPTAQALQLDLEEFAREHKLAMSSIRIAKLMGALFEKRNDAWIRAQRAHSDHFIEVSSQGEDGLGMGGMPPFLAVGSAPSTPASEGGSLPSEHRTPVPGELRPNTGASGLTPAPAVPVTRRSRALWLVGAVLAGAAAVAFTMADKAMSGSNDQATVAALTADVEKLAATLDSAARSAHLRADGIATTPMLRQAIETDAATLADLANTEMVFTADHGEVLEVFQFRGERATSLLRIPKTALSVQPLKGRITQFRSDGKSVNLAASAPISGYSAGISGGLVISSPIDLSAIQRSLAEHASRATLTGLGSEIALIGPSDGATAPPLTLAVPSSGDWNAKGTTVVAVPKPTSGLAWAGQARVMSGGLAALLLVGFVVSLVRRPRS
ncbi:MAG TPA: serine/threonine-protein kinase [Kofleriaceae bacterium]